MPPLAPASTPAGKAIRELREKRGETQDEFADFLGLSQGTISRVEAGKQALSYRVAWITESRCGLRTGTLLKLAEQDEGTTGTSNAGCSVFPFRPAPIWAAA